MTLKVDEREGACVFRVRIAPNGGRNEVIGKHGDAIRIRVTAPPREGRANEALRGFLAEQLDVSRPDVAIVSGHTSRWKRVRVRNVTADAVRRLLK